jgi:ribosomal protein S18 acetylase RimI-like enzyme
METIRVRPARESDRSARGELLALAFAEEFGPAFGPDSARHAAILREFPLHPDTYVAELDGKLAGTLTLRLHPRAELREAWVSWRALRRHLSWWEAVRAVFVLSALDGRPPPPTTALVEAVAVYPEMRRRGVARALLQRALGEARLAGKRELGLYVADTNGAARALYRQLGFVVRGARRSRWAQRYFRFDTLLYMTRSLPEET